MSKNYRHQVWGWCKVPGSIPSTRERWISDVMSPLERTQAYGIFQLYHCLAASLSSSVCSHGTERELAGSRGGLQTTAEMSAPDRERSKDLNSSLHFLSKAYLSPTLLHWAWLRLLLCDLFILVLRMELGTLHLSGKCSASEPRR